MQPDTRNSVLAPNEPSAAFFGNSRCLASAHCEPVSLNTGRLANRAGELKRNNLIFDLHRDLQGRFQVGIFSSHADGAYPRNCMVEPPRNRVSVMHFKKFLVFLLHSSVGERVSKPRYVPVLVSSRKLCSGSKKWKWSILWTILCHPDQFENINSRTLRCLMRR